MQTEKCDTCRLRYICEEQAEFICKKRNYFDYIPETEPKVEMVLIIHAKWIPIVNISNPKEDIEKIGSKCSNCGGHGHYTDRYCKHCGALMED